MVRRPCYGFTLIEVLIASSLGLSVIAGLVALLVSLEHQVRYVNARASLQETGRFLTVRLLQSLKTDKPVTVRVLKKASHPRASPGQPALFIRHEVKGALQGEVFFLWGVGQRTALFHQSVDPNHPEEPRGNAESLAEGIERWAIHKRKHRLVIAFLLRTREGGLSHHQVTSWQGEPLVSTDGYLRLGWPIAIKV